MSDLIERWKVLNAIDSIETEIEDGYGFQYEKWKEHFAKMPSAQQQYEPVTAEDFAKTMSENSLYNFVAWHQEALTLMKEHGFVICKKTM